MNDNWLKKFLNVYWLRPENAFWRAINCITMKDVEFLEPSLDLSCGDGIFSFIRAGGDFDLSFDIFSAVGNIERFYDNVDIYDASPEDYSPTIKEVPKYKISVGTDWKQNLLDKAHALDFYRELINHNNNDPLPFDSNSFMTVFSNSVYWVPDNIKGVLGEIARILKPEGKAILVLKTSDIFDYTLDRFEGELGSEWLKLIDRGRRKNRPRLYNDGEWTTILEDCGFTIIDRLPQATWLHAHIWDIGLRPLSPVMIEMTDNLTPEKRLDIKKKWIDIWEKLLSPFSVPGIDLGIERPPAEIIYVLRKS